MSDFADDFSKRKPSRCGCPEHLRGRHCPACHGTGWLIPGFKDRCIVCSIAVVLAQDVLRKLHSASAREALSALERALGDNPNEHPMYRKST